MNLKKYNEIVTHMEGAFIGHITNSMQSAHIKEKKTNEIELIIAFLNKPSTMDLKIVDAIIFDFFDSLGKENIKFNYKLILYGDRVQYKLYTYTPIFVKYDPDLDALD